MGIELVLTGRFVDSEDGVGALLEVALGQELRGNLRSELAGDGGGVLSDGLSGGESGHETSGDVGELHVD